MAVSRSGKAAISPRPGSRRSGEGAIDTIESLVVAFILAFVFRAFIVEAFVIPTGSMACTLYGEHWTHTCTACGYEYAVGAQRTPHGAVRRAKKITCPNCRWIDDSPAARPEGGDRILVLKWPLDFAPLIPRLDVDRWDVVVFKDPADGTTNFIKRLVGLPDEVLKIYDGDIYTAKTASLKPALRDRLDEIRHHKYVYRVSQSRAGRPGPNNDQPNGDRSAEALELMQRLNAEIRAELDGHLEICRKTRKAQESLWFVVYDHDYPPQRRRRQRDHIGVPRWVPLRPSASPPWRVEERRLIFAGLRSGHGAVAFEGKQIQDDYAYNVPGNSWDASARDRFQPVGDLRLRFVLVPKAFQSDGYVRLSLPNHGGVLRATIFADGRVVLEGDPEPHEPVTERVQPFSIGRPVEIGLSNVDCRASLRLNAEQVLAYEDEGTLARIRARRESAEAASDGQRRVEIAAAYAEFELRHVVLERDVCYRSPRIMEAGNSDPANQGEGNPWRGKPGWGTDEQPVLLRSHEYFTLGDNSPQSKDSRLWWWAGPHLIARGEQYQLGTVPADQLIGKAFFVYWPSGHRARWAGNLAIIPNVGKMRWIH